MGDFRVALGLHFHVPAPRAAAWAAGHHDVAAIEPAAFVARFDHAPDGEVVLVRHREVRVAPVHPLAKSSALFADDARELEHPIFAVLDELADTQTFDIAFVGEAELAFNLDFDP